MARARKTPAKPKARKPRAGKQKPTSVIEQDDCVLLATEAAEAGPAAEIETANIVLPECMDSSAADSLKELLLASRGRSTEVDASQVRRVGALSLQVLVAASRTWKADGQPYAVVNPSQELTGTIALLGLAADELSIGGM